MIKLHVPSRVLAMLRLVTLLSVLFLTATFKSLALSQNNHVSVDLGEASRIVSDQFLSVTIDSYALESNWYGIDLKSLQLISMGKALAPAMLRIGGTAQDFLLFSDNNTEEHSFPKIDYDTYYSHKLRLEDMQNFTMSSSQWDAINEFVLATGWDFIFGLNVFLRKPDGSWDSTNAEKLMKYTISKGYQVNWELGNEPNQFPNTSVVTAKQLAKDYHTLSKLLHRLHLEPNYIAGPDVTEGGDDFLEGFLNRAHRGTLNAITWHHYYESGESAVLPDFFNPEVLDRFLYAAQKIVSETLEHDPNKELWLGETSSCYDGGSPELSASYVAGFMWLDKLGLAAIINHTRVLRQTFIGGSYGLLDIDGTPLPDFWLSAVYKKIVGTRVLNVHNSTRPGRYVRVYAHCAKTPLYPVGSVVLIILNLNTFNTSITLNNPALISSRRDVYWLTPPGGAENIMSKQVTLNGKLLELVDNSIIPELSPAQQEPNNNIHLPLLSFGFYVFKDVKAEGCIPTKSGVE